MTNNEVRQMCRSCNNEFSELLYREAVQRQIIKGTYCNKCLKKELERKRAEILSIQEVAQFCKPYGSFPLSPLLEGFELLPLHKKEIFRKYAPIINSIDELINQTSPSQSAPRP